MDEGDVKTITDYRLSKLRRLVNKLPSGDDKTNVSSKVDKVGQAIDSERQTSQTKLETSQTNLTKADEEVKRLTGELAADRSKLESSQEEVRMLRAEVEAFEDNASSTPSKKRSREPGVLTRDRADGRNGSEAGRVKAVQERVKADSASSRRDPIEDPYPRARQDVHDERATDPRRREPARGQIGQVNEQPRSTPIPTGPIADRRHPTPATHHVPQSKEMKRRPGHDCYRPDPAGPVYRQAAACTTCRNYKAEDECDGEVHCGRCKAISKQRCRYKLCLEGERCKYPGCTLLHPNQWDEKTESSQRCVWKAQESTPYCGPPDWLEQFRRG